MRARCWVCGSFLWVVAVAGCGGGGTPPLDYSIDPSVAPVVDSLPDGRGGVRPLAAVQDATGQSSMFITDEVIVSPGSQAELDAFLARYDGTVIATDAVPTPPAVLGIQLSPADMLPTQYTVQLDASQFPLDTFVADAAAVHIGGKATISSDLGARLLALVVHEQAGGLTISPNFVDFGSAPLVSTQEQPDGSGGYANAFSFGEFGGGPGTSRSNLAATWTYISDRKDLSRVYVAIIDGGFWLDSSGHPMVTTGTVSDLPSSPAQYDFAQDDFIADGINLNRCTGGNICDYHGNEAADTAAGQLDNQYGAAGTGGLVARPMLFKFDGSWDQASRALRTAVAWGASVASMSFSGSCDNVFCDGYFELNLYPAIRNGRDHDLVMVAAAGNDTQSADGKVPCKADDVICVGALEDGTNTAKGYSNWGSKVDIWAPTDIHVMPDGDDGSLHYYGGTSASTPFVAGVAAMMKSLDPALTSSEVEGILRQTAWKDSSDPEVTAYLNALAAVENVGGQPPAVQITEPSSGASIDFESNLLGGVSLSATATDSGSSCCTYAWSTNVDGPIGTGQTLSYEFQTPGTRTVTVEATDGHGAVGYTDIPIDVVDAGPTARIRYPTEGQHLYASTPYTISAQTYLTPPPTSLSYAWSVMNYGYTYDAQYTGTTPQVVFPQPDDYIIFLTVTDDFGKTGMTYVHVTVDPVPVVPVIASITLNGLAVQPENDWILGTQFTVIATATGQTLPLSYQWTWRNTDNASCPEVPLSNTSTFYWDTTANASTCMQYGYGVLTLYVTDGNQQMTSQQVVMRFITPPA